MADKPILKCNKCGAESDNFHRKDCFVPGCNGKMLPKNKDLIQ